MNPNIFREKAGIPRNDLLRKSLQMADPNGWFMEFGVHTGRSLNMMASWHPDTTFYGFDSFEGLPSEWKRSDTSTYKVGHFSHEIPKMKENVELVKGFFDTSLSKWIDENAYPFDYVSFVHIDSDLYESAKTVLSELDDYFRSGTIIVFDELVDWQDSGIYPYWKDGEWKALCEWVNEYDREFDVIGRGLHYEASIRVK